MGYYQGDPGFLSFIPRLLRFGGRTAMQIAGIGGRQVPRALPTAAGAGAGSITRAATAAVERVVSPVTGAIARHPGVALGGTLAAAGAAALGEHMLAPGHPGMMPPGMAPRGFHMSKARRGHPSHLVRNRRMRVTNPRALRRAIRRATGFARLARRVLHFTSPRAPRGRAIFRHKRRAPRARVS
jgi:hypothetical protein